MAEPIIVFEGRVTKIERSTNGYGDNERTVGIDVTIQSRWDEVDPADGSVTPYTRSHAIHLPKGFTQPFIGDSVTLILGRYTSPTAAPADQEQLKEVERAEIAELVADEDLDVKLYPQSVDPDLGEPDYESARQGGSE